MVTSPINSQWRLSTFSLHIALINDCNTVIFFYLNLNKDSTTNNTMLFKNGRNNGKNIGRNIN